MLKLERPLVTLDVESTGLDPQSDAITFFAGIKLFPDGERQTCSTYVKPWKAIPPDVEALTGITNAQVAIERPFAMVAVQLFDFMSSCDLCGYNLRGFDLQILYEEFARCRMELVLDGVKVIDPGTIFKLKEPRDLTAAVRFYCGREMQGAHTASMTDAAETLSVLEAQLARYDVFTPKPLPQDLAELDTFCAIDRDGGRRLDLAGTVVVDKNGVARFTHKKVRGVAVKDDMGYLDWMLRSNFPRETNKRLIELREKIWAETEAERQAYQPQGALF